MNNELIVKERKPNIYLICGKARHGKDTFSGFLKETYEANEKKAIITHLSKYIKYYAMEMTGWDLSDETKPRELLQKLGTDVIRQKLGKEKLFIERMLDDIDIFSCFYDAIIISDVRFELEVNMIKEKFKDTKIIHITRPDFDNGLTEEQKKHPTETNLDGFNGYTDEVINTTLDNLKEDAEKIYTKYESEV